MTIIEVRVPDIGDFGDVPVIELLAGPGDRVAADDPLVTLESDKATMDVPAPQAGEVESVAVAVGDNVSQGDLLLSLKIEAAAEPAAKRAAASPDEPSPGTDPGDPGAGPPSDTGVHEAGDGPDVGLEASTDPRAPTTRLSPTATIETSPPGAPRLPHATPALRRFARELGADLSRVSGTGRKGRITEEDVKQFVKTELTKPPTSAPGAFSVDPIPTIDFGRFGEIETRTLSRIKRISGPHLQRAWLNVPHVTHHDQADITELEAFRQAMKGEATQAGVRVTVLTFVMKALVHALREFPTFNASLAPDGQSLILKKYFHVGIAVDTPNGLVVPVVRDVETKGILALAAELGEVSLRAREGKLRPDDLQGGCMSISSLGGIGGLGFTPIVNVPEVAILGLTRARMTPVWDGQAFAPRLMLPVDLSYDHRVIDGAEGARFTARLGELLTDVRRLLL